MKRSKLGSVAQTSILVMGLGLGGLVGAQRAAAQAASQVSPEVQAQMRAKTQPEIDRQRTQAEQDARKTIDQDAVAAVEETRKALELIAAQQYDQALAAIERATGKIDVLVARNPKTALLPIEVNVEVLDLAPLDVKEINLLAKGADRAMDDEDYPAARAYLQGLISEIRVRTWQLPIAGYPVALREAARLLDAKEPAKAALVLQTALNTLVLSDRVTPLPLVVAQAAVGGAQEIGAKDKEAAKQLLEVARLELERAKELGYAGNDPEYKSLNEAIASVEKQIDSDQDTASAFAKLKERIASFFRRQSETEKKSEIAMNR